MSNFCSGPFADAGARHAGRARERVDSRAPSSASAGSDVAAETSRAFLMASRPRRRAAKVEVEDLDPRQEPAQLDELAGVAGECVEWRSMSEKQDPETSANDTRAMSKADLARHIRTSGEPLLRYFDGRDLPEERAFPPQLADGAKPSATARMLSDRFEVMARDLVEACPESADRALALRALIEARSHAIRAILYP
jgi:hypothetical protein